MKDFFFFVLVLVVSVFMVRVVTGCASKPCTCEVGQMRNQALYLQGVAEGRQSCAK